MFPSLFANLDINKFYCDICELAKHRRAVFSPSNNKSLFPFDLIHKDIWGPSIIPNISGACWFVTFIDDCTQITWIFFLKSKSDVSDILQNFFSMIQTQFGAQIKWLGLKMPKIILTKLFPPIFIKGVLFMSFLVFLPHNKMAL